MVHDILKEMLLDSAPSYIIIGSSSAELTAILKQLEQERRRRAESALLLDMVGCRSHEESTARLSTLLGAEVPDDVSSPSAFADMVWERARGALIILDAVDEIVECDAARSYRFLSSLRSLQAMGGCSVVMSGYRLLHRMTLDQRSPLYNFAPVRVIGSLYDDEANAPDGDRKFKVGAKVKFTGTFLKSTGQAAGEEGRRVWTVRACECSSCRSGRLVCTDQKYDGDEVLTRFYTEEEIASFPYLRWRHIAVANLMPARPKKQRGSYYP